MTVNRSGFLAWLGGAATALLAARGMYRLTEPQPSSGREDHRGSDRRIARLAGISAAGTFAVILLFIAIEPLRSFDNLYVILLIAAVVFTARASSALPLYLRSVL